MFYLIGYDDNSRKFIRGEFKSRSGAYSAKEKNDYEYQQGYYVIEADSEREALSKSDPRDHVSLKGA